MTEVFLAMVAATIGLPVLVACVVFAFWRSTRYFALPPLLGLAAATIVASTSGDMARIAFVIVFSVVTVPLALACGVVALIGSVESRWPNGVRNAAAAALVMAVLLLVIGEIDRPGSEPTGQWSGTVRNQSVAMLANGMVEERMEVALDDGRTVRATAIREATVVPFPAPHFPARFEPEQVRVQEYRSALTGRSSYKVVRAQVR